MPGRPTPRRSAKFHFCATNRLCQRNKGIWRDDAVELEQSLSPYGLGLARQKSPLSVGEADAPSAQAILEQSVLGLKELDDDQLMAMNPSRDHHKQKRE